MALITEDSVRAAIRVRSGRRVYYLPPAGRLTPKARDWLAREGVEVIEGEQRPPKTYQTVSGEALTEKPEHMTHLRENILVDKDHPRIEFRGRIDSLEAEILLAQQASADYPVLRDELEEVLGFVRNLIRADVLDEPVTDICLLGMDAARLREHSHYPDRYYGQGHFMPSWRDPAALLAVNRVRTAVRETERAAYRAFRDETGAVRREDIILALNRLSSLCWILEIRLKAGKYDTTARRQGG